MRVSLRLLSLLVLVLPGEIATADPTEFPYEAVVENDGIVVRSGPGERYDPTMKLNSGDRVTVQRHDPGGWFMISPPPGSFSWIDAAYVERTGQDAGVVRVPSKGDQLPPRVVVWIGSDFTNEHKYFGRQLADGDPVQILGEKSIPTDQGAATFYKIAPPRLEYRWVKGDFIVPLSDSSRIAGTVPTPAISAAPQESNPFARPLTSTDRSGSQAMPAPGFPPESAPVLLERDLTRSAPSSEPADPAASSGDRESLYQLDDQLKAMLAQTPAHWDLEGMDQAYRELQSRAGAGIAAQIDSRLAAIAARRKIKSEYDAFVSVVTETERRDAALLSMQQAIASGVPLDSAAVELGQATGFPQEITAGDVPTTPTVPTPTPAAATPNVGGPQTPQAAPVPQMDGAGIVHRLPRPAPGLPLHALVSPEGHHLAYLTAGEGVRLDQYLGKSMGVIGRRSHDARLRSDIIVVERLIPVRLQPQ